jgi:hypothetical protein
MQLGAHYCLTGITEPVVYRKCLTEIVTGAEPQLYMCWRLRNRYVHLPIKKMRCKVFSGDFAWTTRCPLIRYTAMATERFQTTPLRHFLCPLCNSLTIFDLRRSPCPAATRSLISSMPLLRVRRLVPPDTQVLAVPTRYEVE